MDISYKPNTSSLKSLFSDLKTNLNRNFIRDVAGSVEKQTQDSVRSRGGKNLWRQIANSISVETVGNKIQIISDHPASLMRDKGGTIRAKSKEFLTIPVNEAEGKSYKQMKSAGWKIFKIPGNYLLGKKGRKTSLLFILRRSVRHPATHWIQSEEQIFKRIQDIFSKTKV